MKIGDLDRPVELGARKDILKIPQRKLGEKVRQDFLESAQEVNSIRLKTSTRTALRALECFLQITNLSIVPADDSKNNNQHVIRLFVGALFHEKFLTNEIKTSCVFAKRIINGFSKVEYVGECNIPVRSNGPTSQTLEYMRDFAALELDMDTLQIWHGWKSVNKSGKASFFPLQGIFLTYGRTFTEKVYRVLDEYYANRASERLLPLNAFFTQLEDEGHRVGPEQFASPRFSATFFQRVLIRYLEEGFKNGNGAKFSSLATEWRNSFVHFAENYLIASGLFAPPIGGVPRPLGGIVQPDGTNVKVNGDGQIIKTKLLTDIPLHVSDESAIEILFSEIETDVATVRQWARHMVDTIWARYSARKELAPSGIVVAKHGVFEGQGELTKEWLTSRANPMYFSNAAATLEHYGYLTRKEAWIPKIFPEGASRAAKELGLPVRGTLLPFCVMLVLHHPQITQSFLENHELYHEGGRLIGLVESDAGRYLVGCKNRAGPANAQQHVLLNRETREIVDQIISLTEPLRNYLRQKGDRNWRYLLLSSGKGFGYPRRWRHRSDTESVSVRTRMVDELQMAGVSVKQADRIVPRLKLTTVRASAAVLVYLQTRSVYEMAQALGHKEHNPSLMSRYLPKPIHAFFQERWIRIFQAGIIVEAMKGSDFLLEASGFQSMTELHEFLKNNVLTIHQPENSTLLEQDSRKEIVFGVNEEVLTLLIALRSAATSASGRVCGKAKYWSEIATRLFEFIESDICHSTDIKEQLASAKSKAELVRLPEGFIYG